MYIKGEQYERAADMYIRHLIKGDKNKITEAAAIMEKVQNDQLNSSFAKACMSCGRYQEAVRAYDRANDIDKVSNYLIYFYPTSSYRLHCPITIPDIFLPFTSPFSFYLPLFLLNHLLYLYLIVSYFLSSGHLSLTLYFILCFSSLHSTDSHPLLLSTLLNSS